MLGMIMAIVDGTVVNVGLNTIAGTLGASLDDAAWIVTGYLLASVITMPLNGWLTAKFGRKRFYAGCVAIFTIASFLCGTATTVWQLTFYRILQGFGGGALQPTAQAIIFETFPPGKRGMATAIFGIGAMVGPALGPLIGGYIIDNATWPLLFFVNIPIGIAAFFMTIAFIPDPTYLEKPKGGIDWLGLGAALGRYRRDSVRARARPARRLVRLADDRHPHGRFGRRERVVHLSSRCAISIRWSICARSGFRRSCSAIC